jgi:hypothetical protein
MKRYKQFTTNVGNPQRTPLGSMKYVPSNPVSSEFQKKQFGRRGMKIFHDESAQLRDVESLDWSETKLVEILIVAGEMRPHADISVLPSPLKWCSHNNPLKNSGKK